MDGRMDGWMRGGKERASREDSSGWIVFRIGFRLHSNTDWDPCAERSFKPEHEEEKYHIPKNNRD